MFSAHAAICPNSITSQVIVSLQGIVVAPHLMTGASDSRHYLDITANGVYRFFPLFMNLTAGDVSRVHGIDERIKVGLFFCQHNIWSVPCMLTTADLNPNFPRSKIFKITGCTKQTKQNHRFCPLAVMKGKPEGGACSAALWGTA